MRLVLVHGINNEHKSSAQIVSDWLAALDDVLAPDEMAIVRKAEIVAPYYGDILFAKTAEQTRAGSQAIAQAAADPTSDEAEFYRQALEDLAPAVGVSESDVRAEAGIDGPIEQGIPHDRRFLALLRAVEVVAPNKGRIFIKLLPQAFAYLFRQTATDAVDDEVRPVLAGGPTVVVSHSLGTIVTFKLLREDPALRAPFYLTLGSPLSLMAVQNAIGPAFERPECVATWLNALDPDDAVTIGRGLKDTTFGPGIDNIDDIENGNRDPHDIAMYLRDKRVAQAIARALTA